MGGLAEKPCDPPCRPLAADRLRMAITIRKAGRDVYNNLMNDAAYFFVG